MLQVKNISKSYKEHRNVLLNVNFSILPGTVCGIFGDSGAGKSALLMIIAGMCKEDDGAVYYKHRLVRKNLWRRPKDITYIFCDNRCFSFVSGRRYLEHFAKKNRVTLKLLKESKRIFTECFDEKSLEQPIYSYSNEMKTVLFFLGAVSGKPRLFALDEPFLGMALKTRIIFEKLLISEKEKGSIIIIASKEMVRGERLYTKIIIMKMGLLLMEQDIDSDERYQEMKKVYDNIAKNSS